MPEALANLQRLLQALALVPAEEPLLLLAPTGSRPSAQEWQPLLRQLGYAPVAPPPGVAAAWSRGRVLLWIGPGRFAAWAATAEVGLAAAGTATEQLVGLGIPALSLPGPGPQFKRGFAERQSRLLGVPWRCAAARRPWRSGSPCCCANPACGPSLVPSAGGAWALPVAARPWRPWCSAVCSGPPPPRAG